MTDAMFDTKFFFWSIVLVACLIALCAIVLPENPGVTYKDDNDDDTPLYPPF